MKKILLLIYIISSSLLGQTKGTGKNFPTFNGSSINAPKKIKLQDIEFKTQEFIANNLTKEFVKNHFKVNDSIEFNMEYIISINGNVNSKNIHVNTNIDSFNKKIHSILSKLPRFKPAIAVMTHKPYSYTLNFTPEFYIDTDYNFVSIYRSKLNATVLNIDPKNENFMQFADSLGYNSNKSIKTISLFSTSLTKEIFNIRIYTEHTVFLKKLNDYTKNIKDSEPELFKNLIPNKNYELPVFILLQKEKSFHVQKYDEAPIYSGCEKKKNKKAKNACFEKNIRKFVYKRFRVGFIEKGKLRTGKHKIYVQFEIDKEGLVKNIRAVAPHAKLEKEIIRVISLLPKMVKPAYFKGKPFTIKYTLPITLFVENNKVKLF